MVERVILISAAVLVGLLFLYAVMNTPPEAGPNVADEMTSIPPDDAWFQEEVIDEEGFVLVDFTAEWCPPCKLLHPHIVQLKEEYAGRIKVVEVDVDEHENIANHYAVRAIPLVVLFNDGEIVDGFKGYKEYSEIEELVLQYAP